MPNGKGRRKYQRVHTVVLLDLYRKGEYAPAGRGCVTDISLGGCAFESTTQFRIGEEITLVFTLPSRKQFFIDGIIRRAGRSTGTFSYGIQFINLGFFKKLKLRFLLPTLIRAGKEQ